MSENFQHRPHGKQSNKPHKGTSVQKNIKLSEKSEKPDKKEDFKKPNSQKALLQNSKDERMNKNLQKRKNKINDFINKKRGLTDIDTSISLTQSITTSNLTALADNSLYNIPPKLVALIALNELANLPILSNNIQDVLKSTFSNDDDKHSFHKINDLMYTSSVPHQIFKGKERLSIIITKREVYNIMDICKVADVVIFVSSCRNTDVSNWKLDPDKFSHSIDDFGYNILSMLRAQGLPSHLCLIQDLELINQKSRNDIKKLFSRYFESELSPEKIFALQNVVDLSVISQVDEYKNLIRNLCGMNILTNLEIRKHRSFMLAEKVNLNENGKFEMSGYIKGNTLNIKNYIHITGFGDYQIESIEYDNDPIAIRSFSKGKSSMEVDSKDKNSNIIQDCKNLVNISISNELNIENTNNNKPKIVGNNQNSSILEKKLNDELDKNIEKLFDIKMVEEDDYDISYDENEDINDIENEISENKLSKKHLNKINVKYRTQEEMEFADEIDTPIDISAKERFKSYR